MTTSINLTNASSVSERPHLNGCGEARLTDTIHAFTDGACPGNGQAGSKAGYGALIVTSTHRIELAGPVPGDLQTNNRGELLGAIMALEWIDTNQPSTSRIILTTDSQYVSKGATEWLSGWKAKGWKNSSKKPVLNDDLWKRLDALIQRMAIEWQWVRGHNGHPENEVADQLAVYGATGQHTYRVTEVA